MPKTLNLTPERQELLRMQGWCYASDEAEARGREEQARAVFLEPLSAKARRIAGMLYDAEEAIQREVLDAFKKRR